MWRAVQILLRMTRGEEMLAANFSIINEQLPLELDSGINDDDFHLQQNVGL